MCQLNNSALHWSKSPCAVKVKVKALCQLCHTIINNGGQNSGQTWRIKVISTTQKSSNQRHIFVFRVRSKTCTSLTTSEMSCRNLWIIIFEPPSVIFNDQMVSGWSFQICVHRNPPPLQSYPRTKPIYGTHTWSVSIVRHNVHFFFFFPWGFMQLIQFSQSYGKVSMKTKKSMFECFYHTYLALYRTHTPVSFFFPLCCYFFCQIHRSEIDARVLTGSIHMR